MKQLKNYYKIKYLFLTALLLLISLSFTLIYNFNSYKKSAVYINDININEVPYISTYYIKPVIQPNKNVTIDFYVTDYYHKEYIKEDYSETFTITIKIDGKKDIIKNNVKSGDNSINIGKFMELGEQKFSIIATDNYGRNSHELFNYFLVDNNKSIKEYTVTKNDLIKYKIKNTDNYETKNVVTLNIESPTKEIVSNKLKKLSKNINPAPNTYTCIIADTIGNGEPGTWWSETIVKYSPTYDKEFVLKESIDTRIGLQQLLDDKKSEGYNKIKLLPGIYRIDHLEPLYIPSEFTLDLNNSTIKLNQFIGDKALMIDLNNTFNSHVINGTVEGDYYSHDYENSPNASEWVTGISISGESKYSSFENLIVKDITGYGGSNGIAKSRDDSLYYTYLEPIKIGDTFKLGDIDKTTGDFIESQNRTTCDFIDIDGYDNIGYLSVNKYLGYQGNSSNTWNIICSFYDIDKNYISSVDSYQYRRVAVPKNAKYMRVTLLGENYPTDLSVQYFRIPTHCTFKNIKFENCRAIGLAQFAMKDMLVENCNFTKCGQTLAKCAYDAEDGWDLMQDVTLKGLNFYDNPNNDLLTCAGHNFVIEDMKYGKIAFWPRTNSYVVRNCNNLSGAILGNSFRVKTGYVRFTNSTINNSIKIDSSEDSNWPLVVKDCKINGTATSGLLDMYLSCDIGKTSLTNPTNKFQTALASGNFVDCYIHDKTGENQGGNYLNCKFENISGNLHGTFKIDDSSLTNFNVYGGSYDPTYIIKNSTLNNFSIELGYWHQGAEIILDKCKINNFDFLLKLPNYAMKKPITISNNDFNSSGTNGMIVFYDDRTGGLAGKLRKQETLTLKSNILSLENSSYIITGLTKNTINNINIISNNNEIKSSHSKLLSDECYSNKNIIIN